jgi:hypothetical protein
VKWPALCNECDVGLENYWKAWKAINDKYQAKIKPALDKYLEVKNLALAEYEKERLAEWEKYKQIVRSNHESGKV